MPTTLAYQVWYHPFPFSFLFPSGSVLWWYPLGELRQLIFSLFPHRGLRSRAPPRTKLDTHGLRSASPCGCARGLRSASPLGPRLSLARIAHPATLGPERHLQRPRPTRQQTPPATQTAAVKRRSAPAGTADPASPQGHRHALEHADKRAARQNRTCQILARRFLI